MTAKIFSIMKEKRKSEQERKEKCAKLSLSQTSSMNMKSLSQTSSMNMKVFMQAQNPSSVFNVMAT